MTETSVTLLDAICGNLCTGIDWSKSENISMLKDVTNNYINYKLANSILWIVFFLVMWILTVICYCVLKRLMLKIEYRETATILLGFTVAAIIVATIVLIIGVTYQAFNIASYLTFPEKTILEYLRTLQGT